MQRGRSQPLQSGRIVSELPTCRPTAAKPCPAAATGPTGFNSCVCAAAGQLTSSSPRQTAAWHGTDDPPLAARRGALHLSAEGLAGLATPAVLAAHGLHLVLPRTPADTVEPPAGTIGRVSWYVDQLNASGAALLWLPTARPFWSRIIRQTKRAPHRLHNSPHLWQVSQAIQAASSSSFSPWYRSHCPQASAAAAAASCSAGRAAATPSGVASGPSAAWRTAAAASRAGALAASRRSCRKGHGVGS